MTMFSTRLKTVTFFALAVSVLDLGAHHTLGCGTPGATRPATAKPPAPDATPRPEAHIVLDLVLADWLKTSPNLTGTDRPLKPDEAIVLLRKNLPAGYEPKVAGRQILISDRSRKDGVKEPLTGKPSGAEKQAPAPAKLSPHVLQVDQVKVEGDKATVKVSDNRHHYLGASGATYQLDRTPRGWMIRRPFAVWIQ
jgi:hypothetical protein